MTFYTLTCYRHNGLTVRLLATGISRLLRQSRGAEDLLVLGTLTHTEFQGTRSAILSNLHVINPMLFHYLANIRPQHFQILLCSFPSFDQNLQNHPFSFESPNQHMKMQYFYCNGDPFFKFKMICSNVSGFLIITLRMKTN